MNRPLIPNDKPRKRRTCQPTYRWLQAVARAELWDYADAITDVLTAHTATTEDHRQLENLRTAIEGELVRRDTVDRQMRMMA